MSDFILVSWENVKISFSSELATAIKFLEHVPEPGEEIMLAELEVDTETLKLIKNFLEIKGEFPKIKKVLPATKMESVFDGNSPYKTFFQNLSNDELVLLTIAAHRLTIDTLQELCAGVVAGMYSEMDATEVMNDLTEAELTTNEEDYMKWNKFVWHS